MLGHEVGLGDLMVGVWHCLGDGGVWYSYGGEVAKEKAEWVNLILGRRKQQLENNNIFLKIKFFPMPFLPYPSSMKSNI